MAFAISPTNRPIVSSAEIIPGAARIAPGRFSPSANGEYEFDYDGGTEIDWDGGETVRRQGVRVFFDDQGAEWLENQIKLVDEEPKAE